MAMGGSRGLLLGGGVLCDTLSGYLGTMYDAWNRYLYHDLDYAGQRLPTRHHITDIIIHFKIR